MSSTSAGAVNLCEARERAVCGAQWLRVQAIEYEADRRGLRYTANTLPNLRTNSTYSAHRAR